MVLWEEAAVGAVAAQRELAVASLTPRLFLVVEVAAAVVVTRAQLVTATVATGFL